MLGASARLSLLASVSVCLALSPAAQPAAESQEKEYDAAFQETLRQPGNLDVLFRFATVATQTGDLEGAVSALERMLLIDPNLPRVRLELGVLYFRLGSYELARTFLQSALASRSIPADVRAKAEQYMAELDNRLTRSRFSGEVFLGMRYQSNANLVPGNSQVPAVRPGRHPQPSRSWHGRLGRRQHRPVPPHVRSPNAGQGGRREPVQLLRYPAVPAASGQRGADRLHHRPPLPGVPRDLRGRDRQAVRLEPDTSGSTIRPTTAAMAPGSRPACCFPTPCATSRSSASASRTIPTLGTCRPTAS